MTPPQKLATKMFLKAIQSIDNKQDISKFCQMLCMISAKTIHGIEGKEFQTDFLTSAIKDDEKITPMAVN